MSEIETTNYLDLENFKKLIYSVPKVKAFYDRFQRPPMSIKEYQLLYLVCFYCALRISEALKIRASDIDKKFHILNIPKAKTGNHQRTTIPNPLRDLLYLHAYGRADDLLFSGSRQTALKYIKEAADIAGLHLGEIQKIKTIDGAWLHLLRKSYSKFLQEKGASREIRMRKLRHAFKDAHDAYDAVDLNTVAKFEKGIFEK